MTLLALLGGSKEAISTTQANLNTCKRDFQNHKLSFCCINEFYV